jgi:hypothetical protein
MSDPQKPVILDNEKEDDQKKVKICHDPKKVLVGSPGEKQEEIIPASGSCNGGNW